MKPCPSDAHPEPMQPSLARRSARCVPSTPSRTPTDPRRARHVLTLVAASSHWAAAAPAPATVFAALASIPWVPLLGKPSSPVLCVTRQPWGAKTTRVRNLLTLAGNHCSDAYLGSLLWQGSGACHRCTLRPFAPLSRPYPSYSPAVERRVAHRPQLHQASPLPHERCVCGWQWQSRPVWLLLGFSYWSTVRGE